MSSSNGETSCSNVSYICEICGYIIEDLNNLKLHLKGHSINENESVLVNDHLQQQQQQQQQVDKEIDKELEIKCEEDNDDKKLLDDKIDNDNGLDYQNCKSPSINASTNVNVQPYRFLEDGNIYICNLCQCTYDSLRSMKAHLWKHSGHHSLSYPMNDAANSPQQNTGINCLNNNEDLNKLDENEKKITEIDTPQVQTSVCNTSEEIKEEIVATNEITIETTAISTPSTSITSSPLKGTSVCSPSSSSGNRSTGGICSVLLEVIEKLRYEECDSIANKTTDDDNTELKTVENDPPEPQAPKRKPRAKKQQLEHITDNRCLMTKFDIHVKTEKPEQKSKRGRKRKVIELINENIKINEQEKNAQQTATNLNDNNVNINNETTKLKFINKKKQEINYMCINCKKLFLSKTNLETHKTNDCSLDTIEHNSNNKIINILNNNEIEIIYACEICEFKCLVKENLIDHLMKTHQDKYDLTFTSGINSLSMSDASTDSSSSNNMLENRKEEFRLKQDVNNKPLNTENSLNKKRFTISSTSYNISLPPQTHTSSTSTTASTIINAANTTNNKFSSLLISLAINDGYEQYVCGLCPYVCYHLPSLKSHMWTHVTNRKFDYSLNTSIINAALDFENKLNRQLVAYNATNGTSNELVNPYELINYPLNNKILSTSQSAANATSSTNSSSDKPMVSFRCSKCGYSTINLSLLRLHKRQHYIKIISPNAAKVQLSKLNDKETQKLIINS